MCRPKRTCPNDCSNDAGGRCNYHPGRANAAIIARETIAPCRGARCSIDSARIATTTGVSSARRDGALFAGGCPRRCASRAGDSILGVGIATSTPAPRAWICCSYPSTDRVGGRRTRPCRSTRSGGS
jgi:hypothetical protein